MFQAVYNKTGTGIAGLKPPAQHMEAFQADEQVGFIRLARTEAGLQPAKTKRERPDRSP